MKNYDTSELAANLSRVMEQSRLIMQEFIKKNMAGKGMGVTLPAHIAASYLQAFANLAFNPEKVISSQLEFYRDYMKIVSNISAKLLGKEADPLLASHEKDRRFQDNMWNENVIFDFIKQSYLLSSNMLRNLVHNSDGGDKRTKQQLDFYTRQFIDAMSPSNFVMTNPTVLRQTIESKGENLVKGLEHLLEDLEKSKNMMPSISQTDEKAFHVGKNLATTKGKVVFQNDLMQLIQYEPTTDKVHKTPVMIIPAWINKFYILDMRPENSLVKWLVDNGYTVFMVSWVNPDEKLAMKSFEDYMFEGPIAAMEAIEKATGEKQVSIIAYCLGGTLMGITLSYLTSKKIDRVKSVTYLTTLVDFNDAGDLCVFIDEEQLNDLEEKMEKKGYLEGSSMAHVFNMLRANDLIWSFVVNNYLMGKEPFSFDLLYWNSDSTRMPAKMHIFYLRNMYLKNMLVKPGGIKMKDTPIDLRNIKVPSYILSTREDHIAPWKSTFAATKLYKGPTRFVLSASGHVAGVVNPPSKNKYSHWVSEGEIESWYSISPESWLRNAKEKAGSWWVDWLEWNKKYAGEKVNARIPGKGALKVIEDAPGSYVLVRSN